MEKIQIQTVPHLILSFKKVFAVILGITLIFTLLLHTQISRNIYHIFYTSAFILEGPQSNLHEVTKLESRLQHHSADNRKIGAFPGFLNKSKIVLAIGKTARKTEQRIPPNNDGVNPGLLELDLDLHLDLDRPVNLEFQASVPVPTCYPVIKRSTEGRWLPRAFTQKERMDVQRFMKYVRIRFSMWEHLERPDGMCGNVNMNESARKPYRALCNPDGPRPCCHSNHQCIALEEAQCRCDQCIDMRQVLHAELAQWTPSDKSCKLQYFRGEEAVCPLLANTTILIMGDSFMYHLYLALGPTINNASFNGSKPIAYPDESLEGDREFEQLCRDEYYYYHPICWTSRPTLSKRSECWRSVDIQQLRFEKLANAEQILDAVRKHLGKPNTFIVLGLGTHNSYDTTGVLNKVLRPMLKLLLRTRPWPHVIWAAPHEVGFLKSMNWKKQLHTARYNSVITPFLQKFGIPVLDFYALTNNNVMSYDGTHYGKGVNEVKVQILLNYFAELRHGW